MSEAYYNGLAPYYKLIYSDWAASVRQQASDLSSVFRELFGNQVQYVLDAACGIGTQSIGLAQLGYTVTASTISPIEIEFARTEAKQCGLDIEFRVADIRQLWQTYQKTFDVVIACDNAIPHLLSDAEILLAFQQLYQCTAAGGATADNGNGHGVAFGDIDNDGDLDFYLANFSNQVNRLYINDGSGNFTEDAANRGVDNAESTEGVAFGDIDNDGDLDFYLVNDFDGANPLYINNGSGVFTEDATNRGVDDTGDGQAAAFGDIDNDGDLDLYLANCRENGTKRLFINDGSGNFTEDAASLSVVKLAILAG